MDIEKEVMAEAQDPAIVGKPPSLKKRGGQGYANITFAVMSAICHDSGDEQVTSVQNNGCVEGIDPDAVVEVVCRIDRNGNTPLPVGPIPPAFRGLVQAVKAYETLTVEAAVRGQRRLAIQALVNHPLVGDLEIAEPLFDELQKAHGLDYLK
jgi:6-phospho-beta-glucosidase